MDAHVKDADRDQMPQFVRNHRSHERHDDAAPDERNGEQAAHAERRQRPRRDQPDSERDSEGKASAPPRCSVRENDCFEEPTDMWRVEPSELLSRGGQAAGDQRLEHESRRGSHTLGHLVPPGSVDGDEAPSCELEDEVSPRSSEVFPQSAHFHGFAQVRDQLAPVLIELADDPVRVSQRVPHEPHPRSHRYDGTGECGLGGEATLRAQQPPIQKRCTARRHALNERALHTEQM